MDGETDEKREYNELRAALDEVRHQIDALPDLAGEADPFRQYRDELFDRHADLERQLMALRDRLHRPASAAATEVIADEPILATAGRSERTGVRLSGPTDLKSKAEK
jgi:hypothetical protein